MQEAAVHVSPPTAQPLARFNGPDVQNISTSAPQLNTSLSVAQVVSRRLARPEQPAVTMGAAWPQSVPGRARQARSVSAYAPRLPHRRHSLRAACRCSQAQRLLSESGEAPLEPSKAGPICTVRTLSNLKRGHGVSSNARLVTQPHLDCRTPTRPSPVLRESEREAENRPPPHNAQARDRHRAGSQQQVLRPLRVAEAAAPPSGSATGPRTSTRLRTSQKPNFGAEKFGTKE